MLFNKIKNLSLQLTERLSLIGVPKQAHALVLCDIVKLTTKNTILYIATNHKSLLIMHDAIRFFYPDIEVMTFTEWDCLPYDRMSPTPAVSGKRMQTLIKLIQKNIQKKRIILITAAAIIQKVAPRESLSSNDMYMHITLTDSSKYSRSNITDFCNKMGYNCVGQVIKIGDYALRGSIIDIFPPCMQYPIRLNFFDNDLDSIHTFNINTQRTIIKIEHITLFPISEIFLDDYTISNFRSQYRGKNDSLYEAISNNIRYPGMEHWLPLFYKRLDTIFSYLSDTDTIIVLDYEYQQGLSQQLDIIKNHYYGRLKAQNDTYFPVPLTDLYIDEKIIDTLLLKYLVIEFTPYQNYQQSDQKTIDIGIKSGYELNSIQSNIDFNLYDKFVHFCKNQIFYKKYIVITVSSDKLCQRLMILLHKNNILGTTIVHSWKEIFRNLKYGKVYIIKSTLEKGFECRDENLFLISEQDIFGEKKITRKKVRITKDTKILSESDISQYDIVVHFEHGIGRYLGIKNIIAGGISHDCLELEYYAGDKLFVPVENIDVISRYSSSSEYENTTLDKLGTTAWQERKAKLHKRLRDMTTTLMKIAAERNLKKGFSIKSPQEIYEKFCSNFAFIETEDQAQAIYDTMCDLDSNQPMDRLICGDVGFGKTEVAMRAAFATVISKKQVAIIVPTTLLCRQHYINFTKRFSDFSIKVAQISRLVPVKERELIKKNIQNGSINIVCGTHSLLSKTLNFHELGLLIIDEEQHFGVKHKERLKEIKNNVHVLTLTATPIPRTLQLALSGVKKISLINTPPMNRLSVYTYITSYDEILIRQAILREYQRGGQIFYVVPHINDLKSIAKKIQKIVPEVKMNIAHGKIGARQLETIMIDFINGDFDILLSTNIIESGIDVTNVNTIIIHRADMFSLAQLYQLRGRIGRSNKQGYAYLTLPYGKKLTKNAIKRLEIMQNINSLGAGFSIAQHDLNIRGAGNVLGEEQSGHIKEVGTELYQKMLKQAVNEAQGKIEENKCIPQMNLGISTIIPSDYIYDLDIRFNLYRRLSAMRSIQEIDFFQEEMIDRFGPIPQDFKNLLKVMTIKLWCIKLNIKKIEVGTKNILITLCNNTFPNPDALLNFITNKIKNVRIRLDHKIVYSSVWKNTQERLDSVQYFIKSLSELI